MIGNYLFRKENYICSSLKTIKIDEIVLNYVGRFFYNREDRILEKIVDEHYNIEFINTISGQFAIALLDKAKMNLLLIRDHLGIIPLYYSIDNEKIVFGTQISSVLEQKKDNVQVNKNLIHEYLSYKYVSGMNTIFEGVCEVPPGGVLTVDKRGQIKLRKYYRPKYSQKMYSNQKGVEEVFQQRFWNSLSAQTLDKSAKNIGVLSSGGIDSSILVSCAKQVLPSPFKTYYIGCEGYKFNRTQEVNYLSKLYNTEHKSIFVSGSTFAANLIETICINEEPLNHPSSVLRYYLNTQIQDEVDVLLSGEGADCLYCGYYIFDLVKYFYLKNPVRNWTYFLAKLVSTALLHLRYSQKIEKLINIFLYSPDEYTLLFSDLSSLSPEIVESLLTFEYPKDFAKSYKSMLQRSSKEEILNAILAIYQSHYLVEALNTITKIGNATGLEFRHPFIAIELVDFFNGLSWNHKTRFFKRKYQIVELGKKYLPREFFNKRKEGFGVPLKKWFYDRKGLGRFIQLLDDKRTRERGIFEAKALDKLRLSYVNKKIPDEFFESVLWPVINLELWFRIFIERDVTGYS